MNNLLSLSLKKLEGLGLSANEAEVYVSLLEKSPQTGYEVAKKRNLSRGNIYSTLGRLVEKGAVQKTLDDKYVAVSLQQFLKMRSDNFLDCVDYLRNNLKYLNFKERSEAVFSIFGYDNILNHTKEMMARANKEISLVAFEEELNSLKDLLIQANKKGIKTHIMCFGNFNLDGIEVVSHPRKSWALKKIKGRFLSVLVDMEEGLIGAVDGTDECVASWSQNGYYCVNIKLYIALEITLIRIFELLDKATISRIHSELRDPLTRVILDGMPNFGNT